MAVPEVMIFSELEKKWKA